MAPPTGRVLALLEMLQTSAGATASELAGRLNVDERTIRRDAAHLRELGIPVQTRRGRNGGLSLVRGYRLPPLMLSDLEALAVVLGLAGVGGGPGAATPPGADVQAAALAVLNKIHRFLPEHLAARAGQPPVGQPPAGPAGPAAEPAAAGRPSPVAPQAPTQSPPPVPAARPAVLAESEAAWSHDIDVTLVTTLGQAVARLPAGVATLTEEDGGVRMRARVQRLDGVARLLAGLGWSFVIHRPPALRDAVVTLADRLSACACGGRGDRELGTRSRTRASAWASVWPEAASSGPASVKE